MYFLNELHEANFRKLLGWYYSVSETIAPVLPSPKYQSSLYIAAHPVIYDCCYWARVGVSPLERAFSPYVSGELSGSYLQLARAGLRLYRDRKKTTPLLTWNEEITIFLNKLVKSETVTLTH